ncbi:MAG: SCO family protein [Limisphaerales bacterium]
MSKITELFAVGFLAAALVACRQHGATGAGASAPAPAREQIYQVKGVVKELKPGGRTVVIQHEAIPGYMPAMTMPLPVRDPKALAGLQAGDRVAFRMIVTADEGWIDQIHKLGATVPEAPAPRPEWRIVREVEPLKVGDLMPDYTFTNQAGRVVRLSQFQGQAVALTFFFTRCPFPTFCPRMSNNFAEANQQLTKMAGGPRNWHLFSISFDPDNDTPAVLKIYSGKYRFDSAHWDFVTGAMIDIDAITEQFGMTFARQGTGFDHNLRTVVIDARGRIQRIIISNTWTSQELVSELVKAAAAVSQK